MGVPAVAEAVSGVAGVSVTGAVSVAVVVASTVAGASVIETNAVASPASVALDPDGSVAVPPLHADTVNAKSAVIMNSFLIILGLLCFLVEPE
jgi:hypothetical protein